MSKRKTMRELGSRKCAYFDVDCALAEAVRCSSGPRHGFISESDVSGHVAGAVRDDDRGHCRDITRCWCDSEFSGQKRRSREDNRRAWRKSVIACCTPRHSSSTAVSVQIRWSPIY